MGIVDKMGKKAEEEVFKAEDPVVKQGPSLVEVLRSKNSRYLGEMLKNSEDPEAAPLAERMALGELDEGDISTLENFRIDFNKRMEAVGRLEKSITPDALPGFAKNSPEFQKIINLLGPDKAANAIKSQLKEFAFGDEDSQDRFSKIADAIGKLEAFKSNTDTFDELEEQMEDTYTKYDLSDKEFENTVKIEDDGERTQKMRELVKSKYGSLRKFGLMIGIGRSGLKKKAIELSNFHGEIDDTIEDRIEGLKTKIEDVGKVLAISMDENEGMRHALSREIIGEEHPDHVKTSGFKEIQKELPNIKSANAAIDTAWVAFRGDDFDSLGDPEKEAKRKEFVTDYKEKNKDKFKGEGFWSTVFGNMFSVLLSKKEGDLN